MAETKKKVDQETRERREFLMKARSAAIAAPAVTLLLAAGAKPASAFNPDYTTPAQTGT